MKTEEKVKIELGSDQGPPIKLVQRPNGSPQWDRFRFVPKYCPSLADNVEVLEWNCAGQTLTVDISETSLFQAFDWFSGINARHDAISNNAFTDYEGDSILLTLLDEQGAPVAKFKFKNIRLDHHSLTLNKVNGMFGIDTPGDRTLVHRVGLVYKEVSPVEIEPVDPWEEARKNPNEVVDEEWTVQEVE